MIKTAIENQQNLVVEGSYIPFDWEESFSTEYSKGIRYYCLVMSRQYIENHFSDIKAHACDVEKRIDDSWCSKEFLLEENAYYLDMCQKYNYTPILIDESYQVDMDPLYRIKSGIAKKDRHKMNDWFTIDKIDADTYIISEYRHWEETHCYLLNGAQRSLLIDTGLGICNISGVVSGLTEKPVTAVATHIHWDHIGGHKYYPDFYAHEAELDWLNGGFPQPLEMIKEYVVDRCELPDAFNINAYQFFQGKPTKVLYGGEHIDLGGRIVEVLHRFVLHTWAHGQYQMPSIFHISRVAFTTEYKGQLPLKIHISSRKKGLDVICCRCHTKAP